MITAFLFVFSAGAKAATYTVNLTTDVAVANCTTPVDAACSLREAINAANASAGTPDTIVFDATVFPPAGPAVIITLSNAAEDLDITDTVTITGPGSHLLTIDMGTPTARVFDITSGDTVVMSGLKISGGAENGDGDDGGGIRNAGTLTLSLVLVSDNDTTTGNGGGIANSGTLTLNSVLIGDTTLLTQGNSSATDGGGIHNTGTVTIRDSLIAFNSTTGGTNDHGGGLYNSAAGDTITIYNSTVTNNHSDDDGGGIYNNTSATLNLNNVTISHNDADGDGGGIFDGATVSIRNTIVANNTAAGTANEDVVGSFGSAGATANGNNLIGIVGAATGFTDGVNGDDVGTAGTPVNPLLGPLQNNFGPTNTRAITTSSPAYDTGNNCVFTSTCALNNPVPALTFDQRGTGFPRQNGGGIVDKGAYEFNLGPTAAGVSLSGRVMNEYGRGISRVVVTLTGGPLAEPSQTYTGSFGYYTFNDVPAGQSYVISVRAKQHVFANPTLVVTADDNISGLDFIAERVVFKSEK